MKVVLFCAGLGTRIRDYSQEIPKPLVPVGQMPIVRHVIDYYRRYRHRDFVLCLGYKAEVIQDYFRGLAAPFQRRIDDRSESMMIACEESEDAWRVELVDTGTQHNIGERLWAVRDRVCHEEMFMANYSDGLTDVDLDTVTTHFRASDNVACFLAVRPPVTFHVAGIDAYGCVNMIEPAKKSDIWINGGYFLFKPEIFNYMREGEELVEAPFQRLIEAKKLMAYKHEGFWFAMDTVRDRQALEEMMQTGHTPWLSGATASRAEMRAL